MIVFTIWTFTIQQSDISAFSYAIYVYHSFPCKEQASFNFTAVVTIHSDSGVQESKIVTGSTFSPFIWNEVMGLDAIILFFNTEFQAS